MPLDRRRWGARVKLLPPFDPDDISQASVPRVIFAAKPSSVRVCRGTVYDSLAGVLLSVAAQADWLCDWGQDGPHPIIPTVWDDWPTQHSLPYLLLKAMGDYLLVFVVCTQCLESVIRRGADEWTSGANEVDREYLEGQWVPRWRPSTKPGYVWDSNEYPETFNPAAYLVNGVRFVVPHRFSQWRPDDSNRVNDYMPD